MKFRIREMYCARKFLLDRSHAAFVKLYGIHTPLMFRLALQLTAGDKPMAEAIVIKTWVRAMGELSFVSSLAQLPAWLMSLLVKCSREHFHGQQQYMLLQDGLCERVISRIEKFSIKKADLNIDQALSLLPAGYRHVFVLHDINGYGHKTIGGLLQISENASKRMLFKTRKAIGFTHNNSGIKTGFSVYLGINPSNELMEKTATQLFNKGLVLREHSKKNYFHDLISSIADHSKWMQNIHRPAF